MSKLPPASSLSALASVVTGSARTVAREVLKREARRRLNALEREPLGYLIKEGYARHQAIKEQDREWTGEDLGAFLGDVPSIVELARQDKLRGDGGDF